ncbi:StAR-related lipid transfer protein 9 [Elysia marginata]|uniref:StAR-related lipid transfer protein 9 n=1 Tax=Elysia marginata TaxID=1093978 RepID=A0AAV4FQP2_9GAST|nr:StAR-related lipid transfer protein 9 [Elysia marginata]
MNLLFLSVTSTILCIAVAFALKYLSLLRWINGHAYVLSKRKDHFTILELLDLFKNVKGLLQVLKDIGQTCDWKPGVVSASHTHSLTSHEVPATARGLPSMPVQVDSVKEEKLSPTESKFTLEYQDPWFTENVIATVSIEFKRFWHREDNGICWLLQMNEKLQTCEFYLIQPVAEVDRCLLTVVTWSRANSSMLVNNPSALLSSLDEYISLRRLQKTPLTTITLPQDLTGSDMESTESSQDHESFSHDTPLLKKVRNLFLDRNSSSSGLGGDGANLSRKIVLKKYSSILKYGQTNDLGKETNGGDSSVLSNGSKGFTPLFTSEAKVENPDDMAPKHHTLKRSVSDGMALKQSLKMNREISEAGKIGEETTSDDELTDTDAEDDLDSPTVQNEDPLSPEDMRQAGFKTLSNQTAAEVLAETMRASNIDLELSAEEQAESSGGWLFSSFEKNIVILKKQQKDGSTVQSYIGKGFVLAPPKTVWDAVRNPRTRFTYDDTIKKVDIIETLDNTLKIGE